MSDLQERLPLFEQWHGEVLSNVSDGVFNGVSDSITRLAEHMFPVGVEDDGSINATNYNPAEQVPVLIGPAPKYIDASSLLASSVSVKLPNENLVPLSDNYLRIDPSYGQIIPETVELKSGANGLITAVPVIMCVGYTSLELASMVAAHELDHWDFMMSEPAHERTAVRDFLTRTERRAHAASLQIGINLGKVDDGDIDRIVDQISEGKPKGRNIKRAHKHAKQSLGGYAESAVATAITREFGPENLDSPATENEIAAYRQAGIIMAVVLG